MRKMISSTSMTSTRGVVLMSDIGVSSSPPDSPTCIDMFQFLSWHSAAHRAAGNTAAELKSAAAEVGYAFWPVVAAPAVPAAAGRVAAPAAGRAVAAAGRTDPP